MKRFLYLAVVIAALLSMPLMPASASDKVTSLEASRNGTTGLITITWSTSTISGLTGYKVAVDAAGDGKVVTQFRTPGTVTSAKICFPFTGNTRVLVSPTTTSAPDPTYSNSNSPGGNWVSISMGALGSVSSSCSSNSTTTYNYSVSFNGNNSTSGSMTQISGNDFSVSLTSNSYTRTGFTFSGWSTTESGVGGVSYSNEQVITLSSNLTTTLYAQWTCDRTRSLRYVANRSTSGSLPAAGTLSVCQDSTITLAANSNNLARTGFIWSGWSTSELGSGIVYQANASFVVPTRNVALYAVWIPSVLDLPKTTVGFNRNGASGATPSSSTLAVNESFILPGQGTMGRAGNSFCGWNTKANGTGQTLLASTTYTHTSVKRVTLFALWKPSC
jgi:uncharacterized repeat protein (TIGR02543 family)